MVVMACLVSCAQWASGGGHNGHDTFRLLSPERLSILEMWPILKCFLIPSHFRTQVFEALGIFAETLNLSPARSSGGQELVLENNNGEVGWYY